LAAAPSLDSDADRFDETVIWNKTNFDFVSGQKQPKAHGLATKEDPATGRRNHFDALAGGQTDLQCPVGYVDHRNGAVTDGSRRWFSHHE
jgi:hypothetical protein